MITFAALVNSVHTLLTARKATPLLTADIVRQELEVAGIAPLIERAPTQLHARRLLVRELLVSGRKVQSNQADAEPFVYRRHLQAGLNGWVSRNSTGKSTVLKSIVWALTGVVPIFKDDVRPWLETIAVEIEIVDESVYTIWLTLRPHAPKVSGGIYANDLATVERDRGTLHPIMAFGDERAMSQMVASFFADKLGFTTLEWIQWRQQSFDYATRTISWDVYAQALFIGADDYGDYLFPRRDLNGKHHRNTLAMYLGVEGIDAVAKLQMHRDQAHSAFEFEKRRVEANAAEVRGKIAHVEAQLAAVEARIQAIDAEQSIVVDPGHVATVRDQIAVLLHNIAIWTAEEQTLRETELQLKDDLRQARRACQELEETISYRVFFSSLTVERCPHCEQAVPQISVEEEVRHGQCRVCHGPIRSITSTEQPTALLEATKRRVADLTKSLRSTGKQVRAIHETITAAQQSITELHTELADFPRQERAGFTTELRTLLDQQGYWRGQLSELRTQTKESQSDRLKSLQIRRDIFQEALRYLQSQVKQQHEALLNQLCERTTALARAFGMRNVEQVIFNDRFELFVKQTRTTIRFARMEGSELLRLKIAFHLALLTLRVRDAIGRHPAVLVLDAPGGAEVDPYNFAAIIQGIQDTIDELGSQVQILIASTNEALVDMWGDDRVDHRAGEEPLF